MTYLPFFFKHPAKFPGFKLITLCPRVILNVPNESFFESNLPAQAQPDPEAVPFRALDLKARGRARGGRTRPVSPPEMSS